MGSFGSIDSMAAAISTSALRSYDFYGISRPVRSDVETRIGYIVSLSMSASVKEISLWEYDAAENILFQQWDTYWRLALRRWSYVLC